MVDKLPPKRGRRPKEAADKAIRMTQTIENLILREVSSGKYLKEVCQEYKGKIPTEKRINAYTRTNKEFGKKMLSAYADLMIINAGEYNELSKEMIDITKGHRPVALPDGVDMRLYTEAIKMRMKSLEFQLKVIAHMLTDQFKQTAQVDVKHTGSIAQALSIVDYSNTNIEKALKIAKDAINKPLTKH